MTMPLRYSLPLLLLLLANRPAHATIISQLIVGTWGSDLARINIDQTGAVTCDPDLPDNCDHLVLPASITPHGALRVGGAIGQWTLNIDALGSAETASTGALQITRSTISTDRAGIFVSDFTDTGYCLDAAPCLSPSFWMDMSTSDTGATGFSFRVDGLNGLYPEGPLTGPYQAGDFALFPNLSHGPTGSLASILSITFTGAGGITGRTAMDAIGDYGNPPPPSAPEPGTFALLGVALVALASLRARLRNSAPTGARRSAR